MIFQPLRLIQQVQPIAVLGDGSAASVAQQASAKQGAAAGSAQENRNQTVAAQVADAANPSIGSSLGLNSTSSTQDTTVSGGPQSDTFTNQPGRTFADYADDGDATTSDAAEVTIAITSGRAQEIIGQMQVAFATVRVQDYQTTGQHLIRQYAAPGGYDADGNPLDTDEARANQVYYQPEGTEDFIVVTADTVLPPGTRIWVPDLDTRENGALAQAALAEIEVGVTVQVEAGDTLWDLAIANGASPAQAAAQVAAIQEANGLAPGDVIVPGQSLIIPDVPPDAEPTSPNTNTHTVVSGDTLWDIARANGTTVDALIAANPDALENGTINPGETLVIPATALTEGQQQATFTSGQTYGDFLAEHGMTHAQFQEMNPGVDPNSIYVGQHLTTPSQEARALAAQVAQVADAMASGITAPGGNLSSAGSIAVAGFTEANVIAYLVEQGTHLGIEDIGSLNDIAALGATVAQAREAIENALVTSGQYSQEQVDAMTAEELLQAQTATAA